jgi:hypothetical protein
MFRIFFFADEVDDTPSRPPPTEIGHIVNVVHLHPDQMYKKDGGFTKATQDVVDRVFASIQSDKHHAIINWIEPVSEDPSAS